MIDTHEITVEELLKRYPVLEGQGQPILEKLAEKSYSWQYGEIQCWQNIRFLDIIEGNIVCVLDKGKCAGAGIEHTCTLGVAVEGKLLTLELHSYTHSTRREKDDPRYNVSTINGIKIAENEIVFATDKGKFTRKQETQQNEDE